MQYGLIYDMGSVAGGFYVPARSTPPTLLRASSRSLTEGALDGVSILTRSFLMVAQTAPVACIDWQRPSLC